MDDSPAPGSPKPEPPEPLWRSMSPAELKANTVIFVDGLAGQKIVEIADTLIDQGYADVASVQITGSACKVTFCSQSTTKSIAEHGFFLGETHISVRHSLSLQVHIFNVPIWISDAAIIHALTKYGTVQGTIRHGRTRTKSGAFVGTGVRFATVRLNNGCRQVPSFVRTAEGNTFRVKHEGQAPTCRLCNSENHLAGSCPKSNELQNTQTRTSTNTRQNQNEDPAPDPTLETALPGQASSLPYAQAATPASASTLVQEITETSNTQTQNDDPAPDPTASTGQVSLLYAQVASPVTSASSPTQEVTEHSQPSKSADQHGHTASASDEHQTRTRRTSTDIDRADESAVRALSPSASMYCPSPGSPRTAEEDDSNDESLFEEDGNRAEQLLQKLNAAEEEWKLYTGRRRRRCHQLEQTPPGAQQPHASKNKNKIS